MRLIANFREIDKIPDSNRFEVSSFFKFLHWKKFAEKKKNIEGKFYHYFVK